jgi:hypothetical protein
MDGGTFPETQCFICTKPVTLETDLSRDEKGNAVHTACYFKRITVDPNSPSPTC